MTLYAQWRDRHCRTFYIRESIAPPETGAADSSMEQFKALWRRYSPYFVDFWQYLVIIVVFIIAAMIFL
jgi:hypothetical protein